MWELLSEPWGQRLTLALVHFVWQGAAVAALLALALRSRWASTPQRRYFLSVAAMAVMCLCPALTCASLDLPERHASDAAGYATAAASALQSGQDSIRVLDFVERLQISNWSTLATGIQPLALLIWLAGVALLGARLASCYLGIVWLRGGRVALDKAILDRAGQMGRRLGLEAVRVFGSPRVSEAIAVGFWRPIVLVPLAWLSELPPQVLEAVIAHELAHIRRWDLWVALGQRMLESLLFYHPAVWWVSRQISLQREMCCDELAAAVIGRRVVYAQALETVGRRGSVGVSLALATSFCGESEMNLLTRVRGVLGLRTQRESGIGWPAGMLVLAGAGAIGLWSLTASAADPAPPAEVKKPAAEREGAKERSPEAARAVKRSAEGEAGARRSPEGEGKARPAAEGEGRREKSPLDGFRPETPREKELFTLIQSLQRELAQLRREVAQMRGGREGDGARREVRRDGDAPAKGAPREGDAAKRAPRDGEGKAKAGPRDGDAPRKPGPRDGDKAPAKEKDAT